MGRQVTTTYVIGTIGPWYCDDDLVALDGYFSGLTYVSGVVTMDGYIVDPVDISYRTVVHAPSYPRAASRVASVSRAAVHVPRLSTQPAYLTRVGKPAVHTASAAKQAVHQPTYTRQGSP